LLIIRRINYEICLMQKCKYYEKLCLIICTIDTSMFIDKDKRSLSINRGYYNQINKTNDQIARRKINE